MQAVPELPSRADRLVVLAKVTATLPQLGFDTWNFGDYTGFEAMIDAGR